MLLCDQVADYEVAAPLAAVAKEVGVSVHVVGMWARRGKIRVIGRDHRGHALYHLGDAIEAEMRTRCSPNSSRNPARATEAA